VKESIGVISNFGLKERLGVQLLFNGGEKSESIRDSKFVFEERIDRIVPAGSSRFLRKYFYS